MVKSNKGPLTGINVVDFGHYYAGPMAAMLLADQGANVIRVQRPDHSQPRKFEVTPQQFRLLNRNKKLLVLDLKTPEGKKQALALIERADVLIENFRPGVMSRLGLDYGSVKGKNPGLVYLSLPGFASTDETRSQIQAWEGILAAAAGIYRDTSYVRTSLGFPPVYTSIPVNSMYGGILGATAVLAALVAREKHGHGTSIETPLADAGINGFGFKICGVVGISNRPTPFRSGDAVEVDTLWEAQKANWLSTGDSPETQMEKLFDSLQAYWSNPLYQYHRCADGRHIKLACFGQFNQRLLERLGVHRQLLREGFVYGGTWDTELDNNIDNYHLMTPERKQRFSQVIADQFSTRTAEDWDTLLGEVTLAAKVRSRQEWLRLEPMLTSGILVRMQNTGSTAKAQSALTVPGRVVDVSGPEDMLINEYHELEPVTFAQALQLFEGFYRQREGSIERQQRNVSLNKGDLFKNVNILDLSTGIAGPMAAYTLAQYGARIIRIDSPYPPFNVHPLGMEVNQGKCNLLVDLKTAPGKEILQRLVSWADLVIHNKLDHVAERAGIGQAQLKKINPDVVVCQISAFGGSRRGAWESRPGLDPIAQAATGLMAHYGSLEHPHDHEGTMIADSMCGYAAAFGALVGVYQQRKTTYAGEVRTSLVRASNFIQLPFMIAENGHGGSEEACGQFSMGQYPWQRIYACGDGWLYVGTRKAQSPVLFEIVTGNPCESEAALETAFAQRDLDYWLAKLEAANIPCHPVLSVSDICHQRLRRVDNEAADEIAKGSGEILCWENHPCGYPLLVQAPDFVRVGAKRSYRRLAPAPALGLHTLDILRDVGYSEEEAAKLLDLRVVHEFLPELGGKGRYFSAFNIKKGKQ